MVYVTNSHPHEACTIFPVYGVLEQLNVFNDRFDSQKYTLEGEDEKAKSVSGTVCTLQKGVCKILYSYLYKINQILQVFVKAESD